MRRFPIIAAMLLTLVACDEGTPATERGLSFTATSRAVSLAPSSSAQSTVEVCPAIRTGTEQGQVFTAYQPGRYTLSVEGLPPGVAAAFPGGNTLDMPDPVIGSTGWNSQPPFPPASATTRERFCWRWPVTLTRDAVPGASPPAEVAFVLRIARAGGSPAELDLDQRYRVPATVTLTDAGAGVPPVSGGSCPAGEALAGRWQDVATAPSRGAASQVLGFTLLQDRPLVARAEVNGQLHVDEWANGAWTQTQLLPDGNVDAVRLAAWRDPATALPRAFAAWLATDFGRPREIQTRLQLAERNDTSGRWGNTETVIAGLQSNLRGLQLVAWRGEAVLGWMRPTAIDLRRGRPGAELLPVPDPVAVPVSGTARELRLAVDPVDDSLVLSLARLDTDGISRAYTYRLASPQSAWEALPVLELGNSTDFLAGVGGFALTAQGGEVTVAWSFGVVNFSANTRLALTAMRHAGGRWTPLGDPSTLPDAALGYGLQPLGLVLAPSCSGGVFLAWSEPQQYPRGEVFGAQFSARGGWDPFGRQPVATLPGGGSSFSSSVAMATDREGRPTLAALITPPSGGSPVLVLRRFAP